MTFLTAFVFPFAGWGEEVAKKDFTIVIDAGHGGKDIGAADNGAMEKNINLGVALRLEALLKRKLKDVKVVMTRNTDTYLTLQQRADIANKAKGNLFISIHTNSVDKSNKNRKTVAGSSVYALGLHKDDNNMKVAQRENAVIELESNFEQKYKGFDPAKDESYIIFEMAQKKDLAKSLKFAEEVQKELVGIGRGNRGVHQAGFWVLWATSMPAVLIELDFICNPNSAKYMTSSKGEEEFAEAIFKAIESYYKNWEKTHRGTSPSSKTSASANQELKKTPEKGGARSSISSAALASSSERKEKKHLKEGLVDRRQYAAKRRRRSETARESSAQRNVETASIPLHSESERYGSKVKVLDGKVEDVSANNRLSEKERKRLAKEAKKAKKEREKQQKLEEKRKRKANAHNAKRGKIVTVYKIQILASADLLKQNNPRFRGLSPISAIKENNLYKYYYGESLDKAEMEALLPDVRKKIPDAFVVSSTKSSH